MSDPIESAASLMVRDYLILAFLVSLGALQIAVSISGIRGLWVLPHRNLTRAFGILLVSVGITTYILSPLWIEGPWAAGSVADGTSDGREWGTATINEISAARNINDIHGGMAGTAYAIVFMLSAVLATAFAAIVGALNVRIWNPTSSRSGSEASHADPPSFRRGLGGGHIDGLDALKQTDAISTFASSSRNLLRTVKADANEHMLTTHSWSIPSLIIRMWRN
ncbi:MAG: hypothetical protein OXC83_08420 [Chloroflexi bacterium]|nr:hypothetical protein [Chloroflexota bacterium]